MKFINTIAVFSSLLFFCNYNYAQQPEPISFFPHHVGDVWQYLEFPSGPLRSVEITDVDTVNTTTHLIYYDNNTIPYEKVLTDSALILADSSAWFPLYKLNYPISSIWIRDTTTSWWVHFKSEYVAEVFNENREMREYHIYEFISPGDTNGLPGTVEYLVSGIGLYRIAWEGGEIILNGCIIDGVQYGIIVNVAEHKDITYPENYFLYNYPNPFNSQTNIYYYLPFSTIINLNIYDVLGRKIKQIFEGQKETGHHYYTWIPQNESSGLYLVVLKTLDTQLITKIMYLK